MYIYGGFGKDSINFKDIMQFYYTNYEWTILKSTITPPPRDSHVAFGWEGKLYIFGGGSANTRLNDLWEFNINAKSWSDVKAKGIIPLEREAHNAVLIPDNTALIFGGKSPSEKLSDAQILTLNLNSLPTWNKATQMGELPCARDGHCMCVIGKEVYLFGGEDNEKLMMNDLYVGVLSESYVLTWRKCEQKNQPQARRAATLCAYMNEYLILIGGEAYGEANTCTLNDIWIYSVTSKQWEELCNARMGDEFISRAYHGSAIFENSIYVFGGINQADKILDDLWILSLNGEIPKGLDNTQPLGPTMISGKDGKTLMTSTKKVQYFTQYMQDIPFPIENKSLDKQSKEVQDSKNEIKKYSSLGVSAKYLLESVTNSDWPIGSFGDLLNVLEDLTGNNEFKIKVMVPLKKTSTSLEELKNPENNATELDILIHFTKRIKNNLILQDNARMQAAIQIITEGVSVSTDNFRDILYFFGKRFNQKNTADFGLLKHSLVKIGKAVLVINKIGGSANIGLISPEYMNLLHTDTLYCPYIKVAMEDGKLTADSASLTLLEKMVKYSYVPFEDRDKLLHFIQGMDDSVVFFVTMISKQLSYKHISKDEDIIYLSKEPEVHDYELLDYSLKIYIRYWNLWNKSRVVFEETDATLENPYVVLRRYVEARKINKWIKAVNCSLGKIDCIGFLFNIDLFKLPEMKTFEKHCEIFNGVLMYWKDKLVARVLGPKLGDHVELVRKARKKKEKDGVKNKLFAWNGYISITKGSKEDILNPQFLCSLEENLIHIKQQIKEDSK